MKVCIAEKPSVAREIASVIGARAKKDGYYEGSGYRVTWTFGHLCGLKEPDDYRKEWKKWSMETLPILPDKFETRLISNKGVKKQFGIIRKLFKEANLVINCGDAGQEGELIQRWVMKQAGYRGPVQRLWISSLTPEAIRNGFRKLRDASEFDRLYQAGSSRAIGDWLLGMNATRLYTLKFGGYKKVLSIGRVQTPTLAMLVERHREIETFVPQTYWELQTEYREVVFQCEAGRFFKKEEGEALLKQVEGKPFVVVSSKRKQGKEHPPRLFDLTSLQVHCNKRFGLSAKQTLQIVQKLYEQKVVTYPRVDTTYLPTDLYPKIPGILKNMGQYSQFTQALLGKSIRKSGKVFNNNKVTDHHAIIPTGMEKRLPPEEGKVYDAIARRFIAAFYPDCIVAHTTVQGEVDGVKFKATGKEILEQGWRILFPPRPKAAAAAGKKEEGDKVLPAFRTGETGPHTPSLPEKQTQPPKPYTEATLLRAMETAGKKVDDDQLRELMKENGIGRPSTRAAIIETLFKRKYIKRRKKQLEPTETGLQLIDTIQNELLKSAELTGRWEKQLRDIEKGEFRAAQFVADMKNMVTELVTEVRQAPAQSIATASPPAARTPRKSAKPAAKKRQLAPMTDLHCPKCRQGTLLKGKTAYGCSQWKEGCSFRLPFVFLDKKLSETQLRRLMKHGATVQLKGFQKDGKKVDGRLRFDREYTLSLEPKTAPAPKASAPPKVLHCPRCGQGKVVKGKTAYGCSRWKEGCSFRISFEEVRQKAAGRALTKELVRGIILEQSSIGKNK